jgi:competence protein ComFC
MQLRGLLDLLYPRRCGGCGAEAPSASHNLCWECRADIMPVHPPYCAHCGDPVAGRIDHEYICHFCSTTAPAFDLARSAAHYSGPLAELLKALKYHRATWLAPDLAELLDPLARQHVGLGHIDAVTFVPLHRRRQRRREFNQSALIARELARRLGKRYMSGILVRHRETESQTRLTASERMINVRGSFKCRNSSWIEGRRLLLVDDVMTTGATVSECAKTLKESGAGAVYVVTVARGVK